MIKEGVNDLTPSFTFAQLNLYIRLHFSKINRFEVQGIGIQKIIALLTEHIQIYFAEDEFRSSCSLSG